LYILVSATNPNQDFIWLIIDDGSTDNTKKELVAGVDSGRCKININYYKDNGGMHNKYNMAYDVMESEFNVCIDSDEGSRMQLL
jgi:glycosyltransferase involved in cell wall biosynthesis